MPDDTPTTPGSLPPSVLVERIGHLLAKLHHRASGRSIAVLHEAGLGLSGMHYAAMIVLEASAPISQQALGEVLKKDRTSVVAIVDELEAAGLVERRRNPADRRAYALELTTEGHRWIERASPLIVAMEDEMLTGLDADERRVLIGLLQRVLYGAAVES